MPRRTTALAVALFAAAATAAPPKEGSSAPDINLPATQAEKVLPDAKGTLKLSDLKGKKNVVLYFYPKAMTSGCTVESCGFRDLADKFAVLDTVVIGISTDILSDQKKFTDKESLNFPLIADSDKSATKAYGALNARGMASRYTFVIDKQGVIRKEYLQVNPKNHPEAVLKYVKENLAK
jgi:peroxiredoxin Q/BCP